jgi:SAM-dependent methyltransferase
VGNVDRKAHWQKIYEEKDASDLSWFQAEPAISLELINNCDLALSEPVIDVGGGASVLVDRLLHRGYSRLVVLDISAAALATSRRRLGIDADRIEWIESDITAFAPGQQFALWHDRAVFHFLTDSDDRKSYVAVLKQALRPGGHLIVASFATGGPEKCSGLPIVQYDSKTLLAELGSDFRLVEERTERHVTPAQSIQEFAYFRLLRVGQENVK